MTDDEVESKESNLLQSPISGMEETFRALLEANQVAFRKSIEEAGGPLLWFKQKVPRCRNAVASTDNKIPTPIDLGGFILSQTESYWTGMEIRFGECARCPPDGAACAESRDRIPPGQLVRPAIIEGALREQWKECPRYKEFRLRSRLEGLGLDARLSAVHLDSLEPTGPRKEIDEAFSLFLEKGTGKTFPRAGELLIEGKLAREYGAVLFSNTLIHYGSASYQSVHAPTLVSVAKDAAATHKDSPITALHEVEVLLIDGVDSALMKERWGLAKLQGLVTRRRDLMLCTIITSLCPAKEAFPGVSVLRV
jgi:hypothetical protein